MLDCDRQRPESFQECRLRRRIHSPLAFGGAQNACDLKGPQRGRDSVNRFQGLEDRYSERR